jgi:carboxyl-terminal processing protease
MKSTRTIPLLISVSLVLFLVGGGLVVKVGAEERSFHQVVVFSEVLSLVLDNYVDPLEAEKLLRGAYEGMLADLDAHGAYLSPEELVEWKKKPEGEQSDPGISVLQAGRALQIVAVDPGSPAEEAGLQVGDQIRSVDGKPVRELSLEQAWRLIRGGPGTEVTLDVLHASDAFRREEVSVARAPRTSRPYDLHVDERGIGVLRILDVGRIRRDEVSQELDDVSSRGVSSLLIDLRNVADTDPRTVAKAAGLFRSGPLLQLKDRAGELLESVASDGPATAWKGSVAVLVNGATAGSAEALASLVQADLGGTVVGEATYGLGSEARLYEMENGSGLLISAALWETVGGGRWNGDGVEPDEVIRGKGGDYEARQADQLNRALDFLAGRAAPAEPVRSAA